MKAFEFENEQALDILADILEPASSIIGDKKIKKAFRDKSFTKIQTAQTILKNKPKEIIRILAILDGENPEDYHVNFLTLPVKLLELLNTPEFINLFSTQGRKSGGETSGSATENTEDSEK